MNFFRSVHGRADTGMTEMSENLRKESEDQRMQRGLLPNTDEQTFQVFVTPTMRAKYDSVLQPLITPAVSRKYRPYPTQTPVPLPFVPLVTILRFTIAFHIASFWKQLLCPLQLLSPVECCAYVNKNYVLCHRSSCKNHM